MTRFSDEAECRFGYHPPTGAAQVLHYEDNRMHFKRVFDYLSQYEPSDELEHALHYLQIASMWANAHVACNGVGAVAAS